MDNADIVSMTSKMDVAEQEEQRGGQNESPDPLMAMSLILHQDLMPMENSFGTVSKVFEGRFGILAYKLLVNNNSDIARRRELYTNAGLQHPNIVLFCGLVHKEAPATPEPDLSLISGYLTEYMFNGSLQKIIHASLPGSYDERNIVSWITQACRAVAYCHKKGFLHRNLKPSNMLLTNNYMTLKIGDFGLARDNELVMTANVGSIVYMAPELFGAVQTIYDFKCDVYSVAITLFELYARKSPYPNFSNEFQMRLHIMNNNRPVFAEDMIPCTLRYVIEKCWTAEPNERPTMDEMLSEITNQTKKMNIDVGQEALVVHRQSYSEMLAAQVFNKNS